MNPFDTILNVAKGAQRRIALSEGTDPRVVEAAAEAVRLNIAQPILIGSMAEVDSQKEKGLLFHDPATSPLKEELVAYYYQRRAHKGVTLEDAHKAVLNPHVYAALLVATGHADGTLGGAVATTAEIVRTAIQVIGPTPQTSLISSFFLMILDQKHHAKKGAYVFADCGLVVDPSAEEMAQIAIASARSYEVLIKEKARVAMLSFSTHGSASHPSVTKVVRATERAREQAPELLLDGELQFDAAFDPVVATFKAQKSPLGGNANVFIFPDLESGNIAYKIAQRIGGVRAIGPILQGLVKPANDLSRGASSEDIIDMIAVTAAQA